MRRSEAVQADGGKAEHEFLTFRLGEEEYGIDILKVKEIRSHDAVTRIANSPDFIKGVINLRGTIVPIIDLRIKFHLDQAEYNQFTVVIILNVVDRVLGIVVDGVSDVIALGAAQVKPPPEFGSSMDVRYIRGICPVAERMLILLDIERLMSAADMALVEEAFA